MKFHLNSQHIIQHIAGLLVIHHFSRCQGGYYLFTHSTLNTTLQSKIPGSNVVNKGTSYAMSFQIKLTNITPTTP